MPKIILGAEEGKDSRSFFKFLHKLEREGGNIHHRVNKGCIVYTWAVRFWELTQDSVLVSTNIFAEVSENCMG